MKMKIAIGLLLLVIGALGVSAYVTVTAHTQTASAPQPKPEHLSMRQLNTLIATAKTPAEHRRIAQYYQAKAQDYLNQAKEHEEMLAAYKANPTLSTEKNRASTIGHCEYYVQTFRDLATKTQELAQFHEQMAKDAEQK